MSVSTDLTEAIDGRIAAKNMQDFEARNALPQPGPPSGPAKELADMYQAAQKRRLAQEQAEREREDRERRALAQRRREEWKANAPARAARELEQLQEELADMDARRAEIAARQAELEQEARR